MALTPQSIEYGKAELDYSMTFPLESCQLRAEMAATVTFPNGHAPGTSVTVTMADTGNQNAAIFVAIALVEDNTDVAGDFVNAAGTALTVGTLAYRFLGASNTVVGNSYTLGDGSYDATLNAAITKAGTCRLVVIYGRNDTQCRRASAVDQGVGSNEFHADSDGNLATGQVITGETINVKRDGWVGRRAKLPASGLTVSPADNQRYRDQPTTSLDLAPATSGTAFINPKQVRLAVTTDAAGTTVKKSGDVTLDSNGAGSFQYKVDTDFAASATDHYLQVGVNATLGNASTPAGQKPGLASVATVNGLTTSQQAWILFDNSHDAAYTQVSESQVRDAGATTIASGIQLWKNAGFTTSGVGSYAESAHTNVRDLFKRTGAVNAGNAQPFLDCFITDAYGAGMGAVTSGWTAEVIRPADSASENSQTLTSTAGSEISWDYTIAAAAPAFSRYVKSAATRQTGSHVATGPDNPASPPATFSNPFGGVYTGPFPAYARTVKVTGTGFSAGKEPSAQVASVFGINSEVVFEALWFGPLTAAALNANGVPTGAGTTQQTLGSGSLRGKFTTSLDASDKVIDVGEFNPKDVAGRNIDLAGAESLFLRRALWDDTNDAVTDGGTSLNDANTSLDDNATLGYHTGNASLDTVSPPNDPTGFIYGQGAADTSAQRATFAMTSDGGNPASPLFGFTSDSGNFGFLTRSLSFIAADLSIALAVTPNSVQVTAGTKVRFGARCMRLMADQTQQLIAPDAAPSYAVYGLSADGSQTKLQEGTFTAIDAQNFYLDYTVTGAYKTVTLRVFARVGGAPTPGGGTATVEVIKVNDHNRYKFDPTGLFK